MSVQITLSGFKELQAKLKTLPREVMEEIDREVQDAAEMWEDKAKNDAPTDQGLLKGQIRSFKIGGGWEVVSQAEYSAYLEWGTKGRARVPAELQAYASQFRGKGQPGRAKEMIYEWCRRVGIPEERWYFVFISIMTKGIHPHPYFFVQRPHVERSLIQNLKAVINTPR